MANIENKLEVSNQKKRLPCPKLEIKICLAIPQLSLGFDIPQIDNGLRSAPEMKGLKNYWNEADALSDGEYR